MTNNFSYIKLVPNFTMAENLETTPPLSEEGYARTFATLAAITTEYTAMMNIARKVIHDNQFDTKPVRMLSIGAGTGYFEARLVRELGLKLEYIFAVEPNPEHVAALEDSLKSLNVQHDISRAFFDRNFEFNEQFKAPEQCFDFILFSHSLYRFDDPFEAITLATNFLKPTGKMLIIHQGEPSSAELFNYLVKKSNPKIFSAKKCIGDHSLTAEKMMSHFHENHADIPMTIVKESTFVDVDSFIRKSGDPGSDHVVSFFLQAEYKDLSEEAKDSVYDIVASDCKLINGKYFRRHMCVGIVLSSIV
jgi:ubiquinone/menaquinone biosynthesis C-methylase UbiE